MIVSYANIVQYQYLGFPGMFKLQFWQLWCLQNLPILATDNVCQFWQLMILANFGNFGLFSQNCQFWQLRYLPIFLTILGQMVCRRCKLFKNGMSSATALSSIILHEVPYCTISWKPTYFTLNICNYA